VGELTEAKLAMGKTCRKICAGRTPWTPVLTQAIQCILYWKGILKKALKGKISTMVLQCRAIKGQQRFSASHWQLPVDQIHQYVTSAYGDYYHIKAQKESQENWLGQLIAAQASAQNTTKQCLWKQLWQREALRKKAQQVKQALGQINTHGGLLQVETPAQGNSEHRVMAASKEVLEAACLEEAHRQFTQAAQLPLLLLLAEKGLGSLQIGSKAFYQILDGTYPLHEITDPYTIKLLQQLQKPAYFEEIPHCNYTDYHMGWK